jgi:hypothetical protein
LKKARAPLLRGNKIIAAYIHNGIKLIDSYAFVATALAKFPSIFNIEEEKRDSFLTHLTDLSFGGMLVQYPHMSIMSQTCFHQQKEKSSLSGITLKFLMKSTFILSKK